MQRKCLSGPRDLPEGNLMFKSLAASSMKNLLSGTAAKRPNSVHPTDSTTSFQKSPKGSLRIPSLYIAGTVLVKRTEVPAEPRAAAWMRVFSFGPKGPPTAGTCGIILMSPCTIPNPAMAPMNSAPALTLVLRPIATAS